MAERKGKTQFKKGGLDFKQVLFNQLDRTMRCLTESNYVGFVDGVEGLYLILFFAVDDEFEKEDKKLFKKLDPQMSDIKHDVSLWSDDRNLMLSEIGIKIAKTRLANLMLLAQRQRLLLEKRRLWDESEEPGTTDPTEEQLEAIVGESS